MASDVDWLCPARLLGERTLRLSDAVVSRSTALHHSGKRLAGVVNPSSPREHCQRKDIQPKITLHACAKDQKTLNSSICLSLG